MVPLLSLQTAKATVSTASDAPMPQTTRTKDEKWMDYKNDMKSLRANLLSRPIASTSGTAGRQSRDRSPPSGSDQASIAAPMQYIDRAKLRRTTYGGSQPLSDAQPARMFMPEAKPAAPAEASYGPGQAMFARMASSRQDDGDQRKMGSVIELKTAGMNGAGLGSGAMRTGVEQIASGSVDWKSTARDRRWQDAQRQ